MGSQISTKYQNGFIHRRFERSTPWLWNNKGGEQWSCRAKETVGLSFCCCFLAQKTYFGFWDFFHFLMLLAPSSIVHLEPGLSKRCFIKMILKDCAFYPLFLATLGAHLLCKNEALISCCCCGRHFLFSNIRVLLWDFLRVNFDDEEEISSFWHTCAPPLDPKVKFYIEQCLFNWLTQPFSLYESRQAFTFVQWKTLVVSFDVACCRVFDIVVLFEK